jgi:hypothetical protein
VSYSYTNDDWNNKGMLLLADAYMARNDDSDAKVILETIIDSKAKQEYMDEANRRLAEIKARQDARIKAETQPEGKEMKVDFNQSKKDEDLFDKMYKEYEQKNSTAPTNTTQPK